MTELGCGKKNPLVRDGKSQDQRDLDALSTDFVGIDERDSAQLLSYAEKFAEQVRYYDTTNSHNGNWRDFIADDVSTQIAGISLVSFEGVRNEFLGYQDILSDTVLTGGQRMEALEGEISLLAGGFQEIRAWHTAVTSHDPFRELIVNLIKSKLRRQLARLIGYHKGAVALGFTSLPLESTYKLFGTVWIDSTKYVSTTWNDYLAEIPADTAAYGTGATDSEKLSAIINALKLTFNRYIESRIRIVTEAGNFLEETLADWPDHNPHMALFLSFLLLFKNAQSHLNELVSRHLDFYYLDVLRMEPNPEVPDTAYLVFELARNVSRHKLAEGIAFRAGKDDTGKERLYTLDEEIVVNKGEVKYLHTIYRDDEDFDRLYAAPIANSGDGLGGAFENEDEPSWDTMGGTLNPTADIGFAISSPILELAEGLRIITFTFNFETNSFAFGSQKAIDFVNENDISVEVVAEDQPDFKVFFTGEKEWIEVAEENVTIAASLANSNITVTVTLTEDIEGVVTYDEKTHATNIEANYPVCKMQVNMEELLNSYGYLMESILETIDINVEVKGVTNLVVANDYASLNASKSFQPLGPTPGLGSKFMIGSREVFSKSLDSLDLNIQWAKLPPSFATHYGQYDSVTTPDIRSTTVLGDVEILIDRVWRPVQFEDPVGVKTEVSVRLFENNRVENGTNLSHPGTYSALSPVRYSFNDLNVVVTPSIGLQKIGRDPDLPSFKDFEGKINRGFMRFNLSNRDLGHSLFTPLYTKAAILLADNPGGGTVLPNQPYTPEIQSISLDYESSETLSLEFKVPGFRPKYIPFEDRVEQFFHLRPFGTEEVHPETYQPWLDPETSQPIGAHIVPVYEGEGTLYIGVANMNLDLSNTLTLLFKVAEGTADPDLDPPTVIWSYLSGNQWTELNDFQIVKDTTLGMVQSGLISFELPKTISTESTILEAGNIWLRAHVEDDSAGLADLIEVFAQAGTATFSDNDNSLTHLETALPAETISKLKVKEAEIKGIAQPYASYGGKTEEDDASFYRRVSERLRHKNRAVTIWDYETLVLQEFPSIYKAKCINHTNRNTEMAPGYVYLVVIPSQVNQTTVDELQPRVSVGTIKQVKTFLEQRISPFVELEVANPDYEKIQVEFNVKFHVGKDEGLYLAQIVTDIKQYLSPWAYENGKEISFEGKIHKSVIVNFVEELSYVDYVTEFNLYHFPPGEVTGDLVDEAVASTPMSILVSAETHLVTAI